MSRDVRRATPHVVRLGLLGLGNVGAAFAELVDGDQQGILRRVGLGLEITRIAVRDTTKPRGTLGRLERITGEAASVVADPSVDVVVELIGGIEPAKSLILAALDAGKPVVTANKELLAQDGPELFAAAESAGRALLFEAAVAGAIPLVRALASRSSASTILRLLGIVNGTTNYILTEMSEKGLSYAAALGAAQASATPSATRPPTSAGTTPPPRLRSSPGSPSAPTSSPATSTARGSRRSRPPTSSSPTGLATR